MGVGRGVGPGRVSGIRDPAPTFAVPFGFRHGSAVLRGPRAARGLPGSAGAAPCAACALAAVLTRSLRSGSCAGGPAVLKAPGRRGRCHGGGAAGAVPAGPGSAAGPGPAAFGRRRLRGPSGQVRLVSAEGPAGLGPRSCGQAPRRSRPGPVSAALPFPLAGGSSMWGSSSSPPWRPRRARRSSSWPPRRTWWPP